MGVTLLITFLNFFTAEPLVKTDYIIIPAAIASLVALVTVSLLTAPSPEDKWKPFMQNMKM